MSKWKRSENIQRVKDCKCSVTESNPQAVRIIVTDNGSRVWTGCVVLFVSRWKFAPWFEFCVNLVSSCPSGFFWKIFRSLFSCFCVFQCQFPAVILSLSFSCRNPCSRWCFSLSSSLSLSLCHFFLIFNFLLSCLPFHCILLDVVSVLLLLIPWFFSLSLLHEKDPLKGFPSLPSSIHLFTLHAREPLIPLDYDWFTNVK